MTMSETGKYDPTDTHRNPFSGGVGRRGEGLQKVRALRFSYHPFFVLVFRSKECVKREASPSGMEQCSPQGELSHSPRPQQAAGIWLTPGRRGASSHRPIFAFQTADASPTMCLGRRKGKGTDVYPVPPHALG